MTVLRPYVYLALSILALAGVAGLYAKGRLDATHAAQRAKLEERIRGLEADMAAEHNARVLDAMQAKTDREDEVAVAAKTKELKSALKDRDAVVFDSMDADRLRDTFWHQD
ncbi:hypothetical protein [Aminobacter sp. HY435]|uniref:hypothetical protein n=1 Tax=Aminobacter sp. HY435 TaxID=2970917 RepID=UPI0022B995A5|nr:hypothetical protein [Aminobacter sp. HY435]